MTTTAIFQYLLSARSPYSAILRTLSHVLICLLYVSFNSVPTVAAETTITFDECPLGSRTSIDTYWYDCKPVYRTGFQFDAEDKVIRDPHNGSNQLLNSAGEFRARFIGSDYKPFAVNGFSFTLYDLPAHGAVEIYTHDKKLHVGNSQYLSGPGNKTITLNGEIIDVTVRNTFIGDTWAGLVDNIIFDTLDGGSCPTMASVSAEAAECPCGDERDDIIAEYKKSYGNRASGNPLRIFDLNIDRNGNKPESYFVPSCNMFTKQLRTAHYTFAQLKNGDGQCKPLHSWALIANALIDTTESGRGLDKWVDEILKDEMVITKKIPKLNSAYRSPARQINCLKSGAYGSRHVFGDAIDLDVTGPNDTARRRIALRWYKLAKDMASGDWFEDDSQKYQCSTALPIGKRWECAHVDWRNEKDRFRPLPSSKAAVVGMATLAVTLSFSNPVSSADKPMIQKIQTLTSSKKWEDRAKVLDILSLSTRERDENNLPIIVGKQVVSQDTKVIILELLRNELDPDFRNGGEEEGEYFYELMVTASLYARPEATTLLLDSGVLPHGRAAWRAAARMGDGGVPLLLEKLKNHKDELYSDYIGVACMMHQLDTVKTPDNIRKLDIAIANGIKDPDHSTRYLAADCLKWVPREISEPILSRLSIKDGHSSVRQIAAKSLAIVKSGKSLEELRKDE